MSPRHQAGKSISHRSTNNQGLETKKNERFDIVMFPLQSLKLADFGLAVAVREPLFTVCGTPTYVAPEILAETGYGVKVTPTV